MNQKSFAVAAPLMSSGTVFAETFVVGAALPPPFKDALLYEAYEQGSDKEGALLVLDPEVLSTELTKHQFLDEIVSSSALEGPNLIRLLTGGIEPRTTAPWLFFEPCSGDSLEAVLEHRDFFNPEEVVSLLRQVGAALAVGHRVYRVHGDLKPRHIFLQQPTVAGNEPAVKLFGLSLPPVLQELRGGQMNPSWMAPEQASRSSPHSPATDVFALGLLAFRLMAGRTYYAAANQARAGGLAVVREAMLEPLPAASQRARSLGCPSELPVWFDRWFARCVVRDPAERFVNGAAAVDALLQIAAEGAPPVSHSGSLERRRRRTPRQRILYVSALGACAAALLSVHQDNQARLFTSPTPPAATVEVRRAAGPSPRGTPPMRPDAAPPAAAGNPAAGSAHKEQKSAPPRQRQRAPAAMLRDLQERCASMVPKACFELAGRYRDGRGVWRDPDLAAYYFQRACYLQSQPACEQLPYAGSAPVPLPPPMAQPPPYGPPPRTYPATPPAIPPVEPNLQPGRERPPAPPRPSVPAAPHRPPRRSPRMPASEPDAPTFEA